MMGPIRVQLSRAKDWRMPPNTVKVDRSTRWGNPFVVGVNGTRAECVNLHALLLADYLLVVGPPDMQAQRAYRRYVNGQIWRLRGKNLACWCAPGAPCHADVLLKIANAPNAVRGAADG